MLKATMTDGYSRVIVLERMRWSNGPGAGEVGKAVDARDEGFGERFETVYHESAQVGWTRTSRVFADDERNFEILGGRVDKLKEKFEKTMRMKAASRFADDGFSLGMFSTKVSTARRRGGSG